MASAMRSRSHRRVPAINPWNPEVLSTGTGSLSGSGAFGYSSCRGQVTGRCEHTTGIAPFSRLVEQVMTAEPYASADRVFWIVDNGSSHCGAASVKRMTRAWPNAHLIHLPVHASWLDQAEIYFIWSLPGAVLNVHDGHLSALAAAS